MRFPPRSACLALAVLTAVIFAGSTTDPLPAAGGTTSYTIKVGPNQTLAAVFQPLDNSEVARVRLLDPSSQTLRDVTAASAGQPLVLQSTAPLSAGIYQLDVISIAGSGNYQVNLTANAAVEEELSLIHI